MYTRWHKKARGPSAVQNRECRATGARLDRGVAREIGLKRWLSVAVLLATVLFVAARAQPSPAGEWHIASGDYAGEHWLASFAAGALAGYIAFFCPRIRRNPTRAAALAAYAFRKWQSR